MFYFDFTYLLFVAPPMLLSMWAAWRVRSTFAQWSKYGNSRGMRGAEVARLILDRSGCSDVKVEHVPGQLTDHYDPGSRTLRLSDATFASNSIAAAGVAAHEAGHAIQHKVKYPFLQFRSAVVPLANFGARISWFMIMGGMALMFFMRSPLGWYVALAGVAFFGVMVLFQIITVPVEINASSRAKVLLKQMHFASTEEERGVNAVLNAAAWTYVAAALTGIAQLLYFLLRLGVLGGRSVD